MMTRLLFATTLVMSSTFLLANQDRDARKTATGTAQIAGNVVSVGAPPASIRRALVTLRNDAGSEQLVAVTDDAGAFAFTSLPADRYSLAVSKSGYVPMNYGSKRPGGSGTPVVVADGQRVTVTMALPKGGVITGMVRDARGRPLPDVSVTALRYAVSQQSGERELQSVSIGSTGLAVAGYSPDAFPGTAATDDRGMYRIYGLPAGDYIISASARPQGGSPFLSTDVHQVTAADVQRAQRLLQGPRGAAAIDASAAATDRADSSRVDYAPVYHPAAIAAADAVTITLGPSEEKSGADILLRLVPTARVTGTVTALDGSPLQGAQVSLIDPVPSNRRVGRTAISNEDGWFVLPGIPPGQYQIQSVLPAERLFGRTNVAVEGRDVSASLVLSPGMTVSGRLVFDGALQPPPVSSVPLIMLRESFGLGGARLQIESNGQFVFSSVPPGIYTLRINGRPPAGWLLRSAVVNGVDASDIKFEVRPNENIEGVVITLTDRSCEISGTLMTAAGEPAPDYVLVVFSADARFHIPRTRRTVQVRPDVKGRFIVRDLPAGDYLISAVTDLENNEWHDPAFLAALAASSPVKISLAEGDRKVQDIRIGR